MRVTDRRNVVKDGGCVKHEGEASDNSAKRYFVARAHLTKTKPEFRG